LQLGGSDQWGNITAGLELIRKKIQGEAYVLCFPLLTGSDGKKFGKSTGSVAWLNAEKTSPFRFHQFWLNISDADAIRYLKIFSFLSLAEIESIEREFLASPEQRLAQRILADEVTSLLHGTEATEDAKRCAAALFGGDITQLTLVQLEDIFSEAPSSQLPSSEVTTLTVIDLFVRSGLTKSKGEARRLVADGGAYINNERITDPSFVPTEKTVRDKGFLLLRAGKKNYHLMRVALS
jgi:tyrosyl-tRNA synthetase